MFQIIYESNDLTQLSSEGECFWIEFGILIRCWRIYIGLPPKAY
jgi:hypothetical protein